MTNQQLQLIQDLRHALHQCPEVSGRETRTEALLQQFLRAHTTLELQPCGEGFYAAHREKNASKPAIALRADYDALATLDGGAAHLCGHDGHAASLCAVGLMLEGKIVGIMHIINDSLSDVVQSDETRLLYGQDYFYETLLGLRFKISTFSFFQPNSLAAEVLYSIVRDYIGDTKDKEVFDLYSGTGTIAQLLASVAKEVIGVEIVEEAVEAAKVNAALNGLTNCRFIAGDVLKVLDNLTEKPDMIILDPPRDGIHPKALPKILAYGVENIVYISCKPTSLARDLPAFLAAGYEVQRSCSVDQFCETVHVETVVLMSRVSNEPRTDRA